MILYSRNYSYCAENRFAALKPTFEVFVSDMMYFKRRKLIVVSLRTHFILSNKFKLNAAHQITYSIKLLFLLLIFIDSSKVGGGNAPYHCMPTAINKEEETAVGSEMRLGS